MLTPSLLKKKQTKKVQTAAELKWPTDMIVLSAVGNRLRCAMGYMSRILTSEEDRTEYMDLIWIRRKSVA